MKSEYLNVKKICDNIIKEMGITVGYLDDQEMFLEFLAFFTLYCIENKDTIKDCKTLFDLVNKRNIAENEPIEISNEDEYNQDSKRPYKKIHASADTEWFDEDNWTSYDKG